MKLYVSYVSVVALLASRLMAADAPPTAMAKEVTEILRDMYLPTQYREFFALLERAKAEDMDGILWALDEQVKQATTITPLPSFYWRRRTELEGIKVLERLTEGDWQQRPATMAGSLEAAIEVCMIRQRAETIEWMRAHQDYERFRTIYHVGIYTLARTDPDSATDLLFELKPKRSQDEFTTTIGGFAATLKMTRGVQSVADWFDKLTPERKSVAFFETASRMTLADFEAGAKWYREQAETPWRSDDTHLRKFAARCVLEHPEETMDWVISVPPPKGKSEPTGIDTTMMAWAGKDIIASTKWLQKHGDEKWWPRAAAGYHRALRKKSSRDAARFLEVLPAELRKQIVDILDSE